MSRSNIAPAISLNGSPNCITLHPVWMVISVSMHFQWASWWDEASLSLGHPNTFPVKIPDSTIDSDDLPEAKWAELFFSVFTCKVLFQWCKVG